ncbi:retron Eco8 family effector endonuclease [Vibrio harveyi]|uniref:retron Eco8 family effector endonuclease n=1 Tax=Vibrio harveyi TaxID=669 RepID=UPI0037525217
MAIQSIRVKNLLSFEDALIDDIKDINCIVGRNNVGKSNVLKLLRFFYSKLNGERVLPPELYSKYNNFGSITVRYDTTRIKTIVTGKNNNSPFLKHIYNTLFKGERRSIFTRGALRDVDSHIDLTLTVYSNDSTQWSINDEKTRNILSILYPFIDIETRHIDLYDWNRVWSLISQLSSFNVKKINNDEVLNYLDDKISDGSGHYKKYIEQVEGIIDTKNYSYRDKVLSYVKVGLKGHDFINSGQDLSIQSDGTNSHHFIEIILKLLIVLTRKEYITPMIYIDEPEIGLHPKLNENLILNFHRIYTQFLKTKDGIEKGKYKTPYPKVVFATHSPNILKFVVKLFKDKQQIIHFSKNQSGSTSVIKLNSQYDDRRFLTIFSDNEARLFFSNYILFVEGATELEIFRNYKLSEKFSFLNEIDIYETNEVSLKYLNPKYSKAAIPFLILNDLDVLVKFDYTTEKLTLDTGKYNFKKISKENHLCFVRKKDLRRRSLIKSIVEVNGWNVPFNQKKYGFDKFDNRIFVKAVNEVLDSENAMLVRTTIEGVLINEQSIDLFHKWLRKKFLVDMNYHGKNKKPERMFQNYERELQRGSKTNMEVLQSIISLNYVDCELKPSELLFVRKIVRKHLKECTSFIYQNSNSKNEALNILRVTFEGKTDTLLSRTHNDYNVIEPSFSNTVKELRKNYLKTLDPIMGKTGGWVTDFLDYAIEEIELKATDNHDFRRRFSFIFPEFSDILKKVSSSIALRDLHVS